MARTMPMQTVEVEPDDQVLEYAERVYEETDTDKDREEFVEELVIDLVRLTVSLDS